MDGTLFEVFLLEGLIGRQVTQVTQQVKEAVKEQKGIFEGDRKGLGA